MVDEAILILLATVTESPSTPITLLQLGVELVFTTKLASHQAQQSHDPNNELSAVVPTPARAESISSFRFTVSVSERSSVYWSSPSCL